MFERSYRRRSRPRHACTLVGLLALAACDQAPPGPPCLSGTASDPARLARLKERLGDEPHARALLIATDGRYVVCFGDGVEPGVDRRHRLRLDASQDDARAAAKLGHLLVHVSRGLPFDEEDPRPCPERLALAREREREAHGLESSLLRRFGLPALDDAELERVIAGYRRRCPQDAGSSSK